MNECLFSFRRTRVLNKGLPDFGLFEDEYFDNRPMRTEELIEIVVSDDISELIINADQQHRPSRT
jgi:hypothetical protein